MVSVTDRRQVPLPPNGWPSSVIPEDCWMSICSFLLPRDLDVLASTAHGFRSIAKMFVREELVAFEKQMRKLGDKLSPDQREQLQKLNKEMPLSGIIKQLREIFSTGNPAILLEHLSPPMPTFLKVVMLYQQVEFAKSLDEDLGRKILTATASSLARYGEFKSAFDVAPWGLTDRLIDIDQIAQYLCGNLCFKRALELARSYHPAENSTRNSILSIVIKTLVDIGRLEEAWGIAREEKKDRFFQEILQRQSLRAKTKEDLLVVEERAKSIKGSFERTCALSAVCEAYAEMGDIDETCRIAETVRDNRSFYLVPMVLAKNEKLDRAFAFIEKIEDEGLREYALQGVFCGLIKRKDLDTFYRLKASKPVECSDHIIRVFCSMGFFSEAIKEAQNIDNESDRNWRMGLIVEDLVYKNRLDDALKLTKEYPNAFESIKAKRIPRERLSEVLQFFKREIRPRLFSSYYQGCGFKHISDELIEEGRAFEVIANPEDVELFRRA